MKDSITKREKHLNLTYKYKIISYQTIEEECKNYRDINGISLNFLTPTRIKHNNKLTDRLGFHIFIVGKGTSFGLGKYEIAPF